MQSNTFLLVGIKTQQGDMEEPLVDIETVDEEKGEKGGDRDDGKSKGKNRSKGKTKVSGSENINNNNYDPNASNYGEGSSNGKQDKVETVSMEDLQPGGRSYDYTFILFSVN